MAVMTKENRRILIDVLISGSIAGLIGGVGMALVLCVQSLATGMGFWFPMQLVSGIFYGDNAILGGAGPTIVGLVVHLIASAFLGFVFALFLRPRTPTTDAVAFGLIYSIILWALRSYVVLPSFNTTLADRVSLIPGWWFLAHLSYGALLGTVPALRQAIARRIAPAGPTRIAA